MKPGDNLRHTDRGAKTQATQNKFSLSYPQREHTSCLLSWVERAGYQDLEDIEPITVAAYIEMLQRRAAAPTVKQHMAAIRMLFSWLTEKGVLAMNPAREVKPEKFSRTEVRFNSFWT
jgi:site-specific recombinase XerD